MKQIVCAVYDKKAEAYAQPFFQKSENLAIRAFMAAARDTDSLLNKFSEDYALYVLSSFEDETGVFSNVPAPILLCTATQALFDAPLPIADAQVAQRLS